MTDRVDKTADVQGPGRGPFWGVLGATLLVLLVSTVYFAAESFEPGDSLFVTIMAAVMGSASLSFGWVMATTWRAR